MYFWNGPSRGEIALLLAVAITIALICFYVIERRAERTDSGDWPPRRRLKTAHDPQEPGADGPAPNPEERTEERARPPGPSRTERLVDALVARVSERVEAAVSAEVQTLGSEMKSWIEVEMGKAIHGHLAAGMEDLASALQPPGPPPPSPKEPIAPPAPARDDREPSTPEGMTAEDPVDHEPSICVRASPHTAGVIKATDPNLEREVVPIAQVFGSEREAEAVPEPPAPEPSPVPPEPEPPKLWSGVEVIAAAQEWLCRLDLTDEELSDLQFPYPPRAGEDALRTFFKNLHGVAKQRRRANALLPWSQVEQAAVAHFAQTLDPRAKLIWPKIGEGFQPANMFAAVRAESGTGTITELVAPGYENGEGRPEKALVAY